MTISDRKALAAKARQIYTQKLKEVLETDHPGQFAAIEADSGDYFIGANPLEAVSKARSRYPNKTFHVMKVGSKAALLLKAGNARC